MKVVHKNHLGFNFLSGTVHVDNWNGKLRMDHHIKTLCGIWPSYYETLETTNVLKVIKICKICQRNALKKKRCLVSAVALLKLKGI